MLETVQTLPDLLKLIAKQKTISDKTVRELHKEMDTASLLFKPDRTLTEHSSQEITRKVHALLFKYAHLPTLAEFEKNPKGELNGFVWGSSFAVTSIIGSVFLNSWSEVFPEFKNIIRSVMMRVLEEQAAAKSGETSGVPMIDRLLPSLKFQIRDQNGVEILGEARDKLIYARVASLLQLMAQVMISYGILELDPEEGDLEDISAKLTPMGHRILLHLQDVEKYIEEISQLYPKLRGKVTVDSSIT